MILKKHGNLWEKPSKQMTKDNKYTFQISSAEV